MPPEIPLPLPNSNPIIAPLWARNADASTENTLYYRVCNDEETLSDVSAIMNIAEFQPKMALIATLFPEVCCYITLSNSRGVATFQHDNVSDGSMANNYS